MSPPQVHNYGPLFSIKWDTNSFATFDPCKRSRRRTTLRLAANATLLSVAAWIRQLTAYRPSITEFSRLKQVYPPRRRQTNSHNGFVSSTDAQRNQDLRISKNTVTGDDVTPTTTGSAFVSGATRAYHTVSHNLGMRPITVISTTARFDHLTL